MTHDSIFYNETLKAWIDLNGNKLDVFFAGHEPYWRFSNAGGQTVTFETIDSDEEEFAGATQVYCNEPLAWDHSGVELTADEQIDFRSMVETAMLSRGSTRVVWNPSA